MKYEISKTNRPDLSLVVLIVVVLIKKSASQWRPEYRPNYVFKKVNPHLTVLFRTIYDTNLSIKEDREHKQTEIHKKKGERP